MHFDVIEPLILGLESVVLEGHDAHTEATPKLTLSIVTNATLSRLTFELILILEIVVMSDMILERLHLVEYLGASSARTIFLMASPQLRLKVLPVLVALPVILAAKHLLASEMRTPVNLFMAFLMLPSGQVSFDIH